jgi:hypothetical protein
MKNEIDILRDVSEKLRSAGIEFMLTGSVAMSYYAQPRMTRDIDIVVALERRHSEGISRLFEGEYYVSRDAISDAILHRSMFNIIHLESVIKVDMIVLGESPFADSEFGRRLNVSLGDFETTIISLEDLVLSKLMWAKDSGSEMQFKDVRNLLLMGSYDRAYVQRWAIELGVKALLDSVLNIHE